MVEGGAVPAVAFCATDVELTVLSPDHFLLRTGTNRVDLPIGDADGRALRRLITSVLPKLRVPAALDAELHPAELALLRPHLDRLRSLGVLLFPGPQAAATIRTERDARLYTLLARLGHDPDRSYVEVRTRRVDLFGPASVVRTWGGLLATQGLLLGQVRSWCGSAVPVPSADAALAVLVSAGDPGRLRDANEEYAGRGQRWLPVLFEPGTVRIGPCVAPGRSACLACVPAGDPVAGPAGETAGPGPAGRRVDGTTSGWLTFTPALVTWVGGLVAHLTTRVLVPVGAEHHWGRLTTVDALNMDQWSIRLWRDPYCPVCAGRARPARPAAGSDPRGTGPVVG